MGRLHGEPMASIPALHALYVRRLSWLRDSEGRSLCLVAACGFCRHRARFPFAVSKIDRHLREVHGPRGDRDPDWETFLPGYGWGPRRSGKPRGDT